MAHAEAPAAAAVATSAATIVVEVVYCPAPGVADATTLTLQSGATVADALRASGVLQRHGIAAGEARTGVWCKACDHACVLRDRDRVELYRPLIVDPKEARRQRYKRARATGGRR